MLHNTNLDKVKKLFIAANYISVSQLYLKDNYMLERELTHDDIKPRLLGHWGTVPGINFVYAHLNNFVCETKASVGYVVGTGHGFPGVQSNLFIEGSLELFDKKATRDYNGLAYISKLFSWPLGFPSHSNPSTPGVILEGGELGYSLSTAYGAILDNPNLLVFCLIGDGEAETGPLSAAWHINKFIDPVNNGTVIPILHLNGYKISGPTVFGRMSDKELISLYNGYGYKPYIVDQYKKSEDVHRSMYTTLHKIYDDILKVKHQFKKDPKASRPKFPMIILRTPKGWTGVAKFKGEKIEGNFPSHQVPLKNVKTDGDELKALEVWMRSYHFDELFHPLKGFTQDILDIIPPKRNLIGLNPNLYARERYKKLNLPDIRLFSEDASVPGTVGSSSMRRIGEYMKEVIRMNESARNFRIFSPDETYSNKIDAIFEVTKRAFVWPTKSWDVDNARDGRVIEMLSEHSLVGLAHGYITTGRHAVFVSYEAFVQVVTSMVDQHLKFLKGSREVKWRGPFSSMTYILTSSGWRQDHNGFSHQNPGFLSDILEKGDDHIKVYFPADGNSALAVIKKCFENTNGINLVAAAKTLEPRWLTPELAEQSLEEGIMIWNFASDPNPDIVLCGVGDYMTNEMLAAITILKDHIPEVRVRFVNIVEVGCLSKIDFEYYFTVSKPIIFNFHGYPQTLKKLLFDREDTERMVVNGYIENGSTTTPFDMHIRNGTSRWQVAIQAFYRLRDEGVITHDRCEELVTLYNMKEKEFKKFIFKHGVDPEEIDAWRWSRDI